MHIDRANEVTMALKSTDPAGPISAFGLLFLPTSRASLAPCSSFGASEARDVGSFRFVTQIVDITAILPQGQTLIVMPAMIPIAHPMRIANEERSDFIGDTKINDLTGGFMPRITHTPSRAGADFMLGALPFERTDTTACHDQGPLCIRRDSRKVDLSQVNRSMALSGSSFSLWNLHTDMQLKAVVPDQRTSSAVFRKLKRQNEGLATLAHRQNDTSLLAAHSLNRPLDGIEAFLSPWILHLHLRMRLAQLACGLDSGKKGMDYHLDRLAMQRKVSIGCLMQFIAPRPFGMSHSGLLVSLATEVPDTGRFHLSCFQASKQLWGGVQSIHTYGIHCCLLAFLLLLDVFLYGRQNLSIERPIVLFCYLSYLFQQMGRESDSERFDILFHATILILLRLHAKWLWALSSRSPEGDGTYRALLS
jgi:hypothetical protein